MQHARAGRLCLRILRKENRFDLVAHMQVFVRELSGLLGWLDGDSESEVKPWCV